MHSRRRAGTGAAAWSWSDSTRVLITADDLIAHIQERGDVRLVDIKPRRHSVEAPDAAAFAIVRAVRTEAKQHLGAHGADYLIGVAEGGRCGS